MRLFSSLGGKAATGFALAAGLIAGSVPALAQGMHFRSVVIDTSPLVAAGYPTYALTVERAVAPSVAEAFADSIDPSDPRGLRLVVRILSVNLPLATGADRASENDFMRSEGLIVDARGRVLSVTPVLSPVSAWTSPANLPSEVSDFRRIRALGLHAAFWIKRQLPAY
ncbi:MAG: hypothetical protein JWL62_2068 [Hyphomicrobiales bacterium]|nr:hypothetical protein [Hyphomicrobiales bacterium]